MCFTYSWKRSIKRVQDSFTRRLYSCITLYTSLGVYRIGEYYICDNFTKTHAFTADEVKPNTQFHKWIYHLLKMLEGEGDWWSFFVGDESEYYYMLDESKIVESYESVARIIYTIATDIDRYAERIGMPSHSNI